MKENLRIKLYDGHFVAGIMSKALFHSYVKHDWLNPSVPEEGKLVKMARAMGYKGKLTMWKDGGNDPHTIRVEAK